MKSLVKKILDFFFEILLPPFLYNIDKHFLNRLKEAWGKAALISVKNKGKDIRIHGKIRIISPHKLTLGDYVRIGGDSFFFCTGGLTIGSNSQISRNVTIYTANHNYLSPVVPYNNEYIEKSVTIGESVWIGMGVKILPGVKIGDGAIIGMGTIITKDVPPGHIVVNSLEQKTIGERNLSQFYYSNNSQNWFGKKYPRH